MAKRDYYEVLGVARTATDTEITKAYRGLAKNLARAHTMFALANLYLVRRRLLPVGA